ncbi:hypothetical protein BB560_002557 [Smittium megazygosporum]|uniref:Uncharacterized protein n=1 Tax=Smittium megazygosporum TaxID=133381 RepID=A0A2T9ZEH7_9FUNG|nr:hypothetical protein BB560_002557 [Smittium megazygosporum]
MGRLEQSVLLPTLASDTTSDTESPLRMADGNTDNLILKISNMVYLSKSIIHKETHSNSSFEDQRSILKEQGLSDAAINIIISGKRNKKHRYNYYHNQLLFLKWRSDDGITSQFTAPQIDIMISLNEQS